MKSTPAGPLFSASDISAFTACPAVIQLDLQSLYEPLEQSVKDEQTKLIQKKGIEHEARYLETLKKTGLEVIEIPDNRHLSDSARAEASTLELKRGAPYVYQPYFNDGTLHGLADILRRVEKPSNLGNFSYEVVDAKVSSTEKASYILQLCCYSELLAKVQGTMPERIHVILGTNREVTYRLTDFYAYYLKVKERLLTSVQHRDPEIIPEPCSHCAVCQWQPECQKRWLQADHLSLVANVTRSNTKRLRAAGITTVAQLGSYTGPTPTKLSHDIFGRLQRQAALQLQKRASPDENFRQFIEPTPGKTGFTLLPPPAEGDLYYDIEGDPLLRDEALISGNALLRAGLEYLHGFAWSDTAGATQYKSFWCFEKSEEKQCYEKLVDFLTEHVARFPASHIYHYSQYEISALKRLSCQYGSRTDQVDALLKSQKFVDLYQIVRQALLVSEPKYSIKNLEHFYLAKRTQEVTSGGASIVWFEEYLETKNKKLLKDIEDYNEVDCISTLKLRNWLLPLKQEAAAQFGVSFDHPPEIPADEEEPETTPDTSRKDLLARYWEELCAPLPSSRELFTEADTLSELLYYLTDFYRREEKPTWWKYFERKSMTPLDLIADPECLGAITLSPDIPPEAVKRSVIYTYSFEPQETKLRKGSKVEELEGEGGFGSVESIDLKARTVRIKRGKGNEPLAYGSLIPRESISTKELVKAVDRFMAEATGMSASERMTAGSESKYSAVLDILRRSTPRTTTHYPAPLLSCTAQDHNFIPELCALARALDNSYLFIQGPPGTGKTYSGARVAVHLMQQGNRIGVTSNSHKGIINFLREVESVAREANFSFRGAKKVGKDKPDERVDEGGCIANAESSESLTDATLQLVAGTAWAFANEALDKSFDYLIVDEAGQFSLAHTIATGVSARNIILIGDPMQLAQPTQGIHPASSGLSPLEHLLGTSATVPPSHGVFLDTSRRMHTEICSFLSEQVYEGRLRAPLENSRQRIDLPPGVLEKSAGILFVPVDHEGNTNTAEQEVLKVAELYSSLITGGFCSKEGVITPLTPQEIIIVAPYNMQVGLLKETLPFDARVGTIDLFQGQEAAVVIVSMTTSSGEELPRSLEFLFSKQRLNVALSRAKALAIVVGSPGLFRTKCSSPEQMALVNMLCALG